MLQDPTQDSAACPRYVKWEGVACADSTRMTVGIFGYIWLRDYNSKYDM